MRKASNASPEAIKRMVIAETRKQLPEGFDVERHFTPAYRVWQQRLALLPDGDLFAAIRSGKASVVTDTIERFTPKGIETSSGEHLDADVVITATGFDLAVFGGIDFEVDGEEVDPAELITYRGIMFTGLPNLAYIFGYFRASWTLRVDIIADFVCRVLARMDELGARSVVPTLRDHERDMGTVPWVEPENFNPGYLTRSLHLMPRQGDRDPWRWGLEYPVEKVVLAEADLDDGCLTFR